MDGLIRRDDNAYQSHYLAGQTKTKNHRVQLFMQSAVMVLHTDIASFRPSQVHNFDRKSFWYLHRLV
jgi:hypothetical protein